MGQSANKFYGYFVRLETQAWYPLLPAIILSKDQ